MDITHDFWIDEAPEKVFGVLLSSEGLDAWWTLESKAEPALGGVYRLYFGEGYDWRGEVTRLDPDSCIEWTLTRAVDDWQGTRVRFELQAAKTGTSIRFTHEGWAEASDHYRISTFCWAMYLRLLKRYIQHEEVVAYVDRLEA